MADSSLDDFFAKKDRKRKDGKGGKKFPAVDEPNVADEISKPVEKPKKEKEKTSANATQSIHKTADQDENEWKDVDPEKDYSGLKVHSLSLKDKEEEFREQRALEVEESNKCDQGGPWGGKAPPEQGEDEDEDAPIPVPKEEVVAPPADAKPAGPVKYIPPSQRNLPPGGSSSGPMSGPMGWKRSGKAPQLDNKEEFPTLGDAPPPELGKDFMPVKHGSRDLASNNRAVGGNLTLGNKYNALSASRENN